MPIFTNIPANIAVQENDAGTAIAGLAIDASFAGSQDTIVLEFEVPEGALEAGEPDNPAMLQVIGSGGQSVVLVGGIAAINDYLAGNSLVYFTSFAPPASLNLAAAAYISSYPVPTGTAPVTANVPLAIAAVNDPPSQVIPGLQTVSEEGTLIFAGNNQIQIADPDAGTGVVQTTLATSQGILQLPNAAGAGLAIFTGGGTGSVALTGSLSAINTALNGLRFTPIQNLTGVATIQVETNDLGHTGGAPQTTQSTISVQVTPVNDAPELLGNGVLAAIANDALPSATGQTLTELLGSQFRDVDSGDFLRGVAIAANPANAATQGTWQYSTNGGVTWLAIDAVSPTQALVLNGAERLRFVPVANFVGQPPSLQVYALDSTYTAASTQGATRITLDVSQRGGQTAIALDSRELSVTVIDTTAPRVVQVQGPAAGLYGMGESLDFVVTFSEPVRLALGTGTVALPIVLDGVASGSVTVNALPVTPNDGVLSTTHVFRHIVAEGEVDSTGVVVGSALVLLNGAIVEDAVGNDADLTLRGISNTQTVTVDGVRPTVEVLEHLDSTAPSIVGGAFEARIVFSERVSGLDRDDFTTVNAEISHIAPVLDTDGNSDGKTYTFRVMPGSSGNVEVGFRENGVRDNADNGNRPTPLRLSRIADLTRPTLQLIAPSLVNGRFGVEANFSEDVVGFTGSDIGVFNGTLSNFQAVDGRTYRFDVTPAGNNSTPVGAVTIDVNANVAQDPSGNLNQAATPIAIQVDNQRPTLTLTSAAPDFITGSFLVTATFNETVTDFTVRDIEVSNGFADDFQANPDNLTYSFRVTPRTEGTISVNIAENVAQDAASNGNAAATPLTRRLDTIAPRVGNVLANVQRIGDPNVGNRTFTLEIGYNEAMRPDAVPTIAFPGVDLSNSITFAEGRWVNDQTYLATYNVNDRNQTLNNISVQVSGARDLAGNLQEASDTQGVFRDVFSVDTEAPAAPAITGFQDDAGLQIGKRSTGDRTIALVGTAEANSTVTLFQGTTQVGTTQTNAEGNWTFDYTNTPLAPNTTYSFSAKATDAAGNASPDSSAYGVTIDGSGPTGAFTIVRPRDSRAVDVVIIQFNEAVANFDLSDLLLTRKGKGRSLEGARLTTEDNRTWILTGMGGSNRRRGGYTLAFNSNNDITDLAGNRFTGGESASWGQRRNRSAKQNTAVVGGAGNDRIEQSDQLVMVGGAGSDTFAFSAWNKRTFAVADFNPGQDRLDFSVLFRQPDYAGGNANSLIQAVQVGANTEIRIDRDGLGAGQEFRPFAVLYNVSAGQLGAQNVLLG